MKTYYRCEICGSSNDDREAILACEASGLPKKPRVGLIYDLPYYIHDDWHGTFYVASAVSEGHMISICAYATREMGGRSANVFGLPIDRDNFDSYCDGGNYHAGRDYKWCKIPDQTSPSFTRMINTLKRMGLPYTIFDGTNQYED